MPARSSGSVTGLFVRGDAAGEHGGDADVHGAALAGKLGELVAELILRNDVPERFGVLENERQREALKLGNGVCERAGGDVRHVDRAAEDAFPHGGLVAELAVRAKLNDDGRRWWLPSRGRRGPAR